MRITDYTKAKRAGRNIVAISFHNKAFDGLPEERIAQEVAAAIMSLIEAGTNLGIQRAAILDCLDMGFQRNWGKMIIDITAMANYIIATEGDIVSALAAEMDAEVIDGDR